MSSPQTNSSLLPSVCSKKSPEDCKRSRTASDWADSENFNSTVSRTAIDWSQLPPELVEKIAGNLDDIADRVRLGSVCKPWESASKSILLPRVRLPWLLLEDDDDLPRSRLGFINRTEVQSFFSISDKRIYELRLPRGTEEKKYPGSPYGWLILVDSSYRIQRVSLLNPITDDRVFLPPLPPLTSLVGRCKVIVTPEALITMVVNQTCRLVYCHRWLKGSDSPFKWTKLSVVDQNRKIPFVCDFTYYGGHYFVLGENGSPTLVFDPATGQLISVIPSPAHTNRCNCRCSSIRYQYLVESPYGEELFLVFRLGSVGYCFEVFELKRIEKQTKWAWSKVRSIGRNVLFVDDQRAILLPASDLDGCRGNCIVSYNNNFPRSEKGTGTMWNVASFRLFDIGNGRDNQLPSSWHEILKGWANQGWFVPSL